MVFGSVSKLGRKCFEESSIHGMAQVIQKKRHVTERFFWIFVIGLSITAASVICHDQWNRYLQKPTVLSIETNYRNWEYEPCAVTICSNYFDPETAVEIILRLWGVTSNETKYQYYYDFVETVSTMTYAKLNNFKRFSTDVSLEKVNLLQIMKDMKLPLQPSDQQFSQVITEMGICHSTTKLFRFQSPYSEEDNYTAPATKEELCRSIDSCKVVVIPATQDKSDAKIYLHHDDDVISAKDTLYQQLNGENVIDMKISISDIRASDKLLRLSLARRKCLFFQESNSPYFDVYTKNLCKITCRLKAAIKYCNCRPFFYNIENAGPVCGPAGLYCLSKTDWYDVDCDCPILCEFVKFSKISAAPLNFFQFNRMLMINIIFPKNRIKRNVLFSFEDLLVSFGGAAALFLGFSFLSVVEFVFFFIEHLLTEIIQKVKQ